MAKKQNQSNAAAAAAATANSEQGQGGADEAQAAAAAAAAAEKAGESKGKPVEVRLLLDCVHGKVNQVVAVSAAEAQRAASEGWADPHPDAVKYAKSLAQSGKA